MSKKVKAPRVERRAIKEVIEIRTNADGSRTIKGVAAPFNSKSVDLGGFVEIIKPGAFKQTLTDNPDVLLLRQHDAGALLARTTSKTLTLRESSKGLEFTANLSAKSTIASDTIDALQRGDLDACSFGFNVGPEGDDWANVEGQLVRTLLEVELHEISVVSFPAYKASSVSLRSCPPALRSLAKRDDDDCPDGQHYDEDLDECVDDDEDRDDGDDDEDCPCDCGPCEDGNCELCSANTCEDERCESCPMQDNLRSDRLRIRSLFNHRRK
jgi:HK97 family phage prohead protease